MTRVHEKICCNYLCIYKMNYELKNNQHDGDFLKIWGIEKETSPNDSKDKPSQEKPREVTKTCPNNTTATLMNQEVLHELVCIMKKIHKLQEKLDYLTSIYELKTD